MKIPLSGSIAGKIDCWWNLAVFSDIQNRLYDCIHGLKVTSSCYPYHYPWSFGEPRWATASLYVVINLIASNYIWSYYLLYVFLFSFTAFAFYVLAGEFIFLRFARFAGGLFFTASNFTLGQFEHDNVFFWGLALFAICFFLRFIKRKENVYLWATFLLLGIEIYFSSTVFIYLFIWLAVFALAYYRLWSENSRWHYLIAGSILSLIIIAPFVYFFSCNPDLKDIVDTTLITDSTNVSNLWLNDYFRFLPDNIIYPQLHDIDMDLLYRIKCVSPGIVLFVLFLLGFRRLPKKIFLSLVFTGFILVLGPELKIGHFSVPMPMRFYYTLFHRLPFLHTPIRAYFMVHWSICMAAVFGFSKIVLSKPGGKWLGVLILLLFFSENVPGTLASVRVLPAITEGRQVSDLLSQKGKGNVLHMPSQIFQPYPVEMNSMDMNVFGRELYYMLIQTMYHRNSINGVARLIPKKRIEFNDIFQLNERGRFEGLLRTYDLQYVVFHDDLAMRDEHRLLDSLAQYPFLRFEKKVGNTSVYCLISPSGK